MAGVQVSDVVVPSIFTPYVQQLTAEKTRLINAGVLARDAAIDALIAGGGLTFNVPSWKDLANVADLISTDDLPGVNDSTPQKTGTGTEVAVRLSRNQSWGATDLSGELAGSDPAASIASRVAYYWSRRLQAAFVATIKGVFANNALASPGGGATQNDMTRDISGSSFVAGTTNFSAAAFIDAATTLGDSAEDATVVMMHSIVYSTAQKNNLIDFIPDSEGRVNIPTFLGRTVVVDDGMPSASAGVYDTWLFGASACRLGVGAPKVPTEVFRYPNAGNGGGSETLHNRVEWTIHPVGHKYNGTAPNGGPDNTASTNMLANSGSWQRVFPERKQIKIARLITRES
jgi:hypothetical protein